MRARKGFTFIELLVYTVIFSGMIAAIVFLTRTVQETRARVRTAVILQSDLRFALARMSSYVQSGDTVTLPSAGTGSILEISFATSSPGYHPTRVELQNGIVTVKRGASSTLALTSSAVNVTSLTFNRTSSTPPAVRMTISGALRYGAGASGVPLTLSTAAVVRR
jgi:type II secretory pathway pseudopilin PulG